MSRATHGLGPMGFHLIPIAPKHGTLGPSLGPKGPNRRPMVPHLWTPLAQNYYCANSIKPWDPTRNLLFLTNELGDSKKGPFESFQGDAVDTQKAKLKTKFKEKNQHQGVKRLI